MQAIINTNAVTPLVAIDVARREFGLRIPQDLSVVGYDDVPEACWEAYALTTVAQPAKDMVDTTVAILLEQMERKVVTRRAAVLPIRLVVRGSARLPGK
jgi:DNA-binding LacI/PurR family transcriptional regulator